MENLSFTWEVVERNGNRSIMQTPEPNAFETKWWLWRNLGVDAKALKRLCKNATR